MQSEAHIQDETERSGTLHELVTLDTAAEPPFDDLVQLAAIIGGVPVSVLCLVADERQWVNAAVGLDSAEAPRAIAFCDHVIRQPGLLLVEDATQDARFAESSLVMGSASLRFFAGVAISAPTGEPIGALCVMDSEPRRLSPGQHVALRVLASQVHARLELRQQRLALERALAECQQELEAANLQLREHATVDPLTGLSKRRVLDERLRAEFRHARRKGNHLAILVLDVDHFKARNDRFGHAHGDALLRQLGSLLRRCVRPSDLPARYGSEEFVILLPDTSEAQAAILAQRLQTACRRELWPEGPLTVSIGVSGLGPATPDTKRLLHLADDALYAAKRGGRDRTVTYSQVYSQTLESLRKARAAAEQRNVSIPLELTTESALTVAFTGRL